jgi:hypothetical protein
VLGVSQPSVYRWIGESGDSPESPDQAEGTDEKNYPAKASTEDARRARRQRVKELKDAGVLGVGETSVRRWLGESTAQDGAVDQTDAWAGRFFVCVSMCMHNNSGSRFETLATAVATPPGPARCSIH